MKKFGWVVLLGLGFGFLTSLHAGERVDGPKMSWVGERAGVLAKKFGSQNVLVVFDIDNTLLRTTGDLGSDQWYEWQAHLITGKDPNPQGFPTIGPKMTDLFRSLSIIYSFARMTPPEASTPALLKSLQDAGHPVIGLTSRGPDLLLPTWRELFRNGFHLSATSFSEPKALSTPGPAYDVATVGKKYGFSEKEKKHFKLNRKSRSVRFGRGIFFTTGLHKGAMLRIVLQEAGLNPKAIIFADDKKKHTNGIWAAFKDRGVDVNTLRYSQEDANVEAFLSSSERKRATMQKWGRLTRTIEGRDAKQVQAAEAAIF